MYNSSSYNDELFDALLTIAFNRLLDEELAEMPSDEELAEMFPVPQKQVRKMQRYAKRLKHRVSMPIVYLRRFAVVCLVIISLTFAAFATSPVVREAIKNTVVTWYDKYIQINFANSDAEEGDEITDIYELNIGYIPDGFELVNSIEETNYREYLFATESGHFLIISISTSNSTEYASDIELQEYEEILINNLSAYMLYNVDEQTGTVITGNHQCIINVTASISKEQLLEIIQNIK